MYQISHRSAAVPSLTSPLSISRKPSKEVIDTANKVSRPSGSKHRYTAKHIEEAPKQLFILRAEDAKNEQEKMILTLAGLLNQKEAEVSHYQRELKSEMTVLKATKEAKVILEARLQESLEHVEQKQKRVNELEDKLKRSTVNKAIVEIDLLACKKDLRDETYKCERTQKALELVEANLAAEKAHKEQLKKELKEAEEQLGLKDQQIEELQANLNATEQKLKSSQKELSITQKKFDKSEGDHTLTKKALLEKQEKLQKRKQERIELLKIVELLKQKSDELEETSPLESQSDKRYEIIGKGTDANIISLKTENSKHNKKNEETKPSIFRKGLNYVYETAKAVGLVAIGILIGSILVWQYPDYAQKGWLLAKRYWVNLSSFVTGIFSPRNDDLFRLNSIMRR